MRGRISISAPQSQRNEASIDNRIIRFQPREYNLLIILLLLPPVPFDRDRLIQLMWPDSNKEPEYAYDIFKKYISDLRRFGCPIDSVRPHGYFIPLKNRGFRSQSFWSQRPSNNDHPNVRPLNAATPKVADRIKAKNSW